MRTGRRCALPTIASWTEIAGVLARHGMVYLVDILGLGGLLSLEQRLLGGGPAQAVPRAAQGAALGSL